MDICTQVHGNILFDPMAFHRYNDMLYSVGYPVDMFQVLEATPLREADLRYLLILREKFGIALKELLPPFAVFTSLISRINGLNKKLAQSEKELAVHCEREMAFVPLDQHLADHEKEVISLKNALGQLEGKLKTISGNERALAAEAAGLRKKVRGYEDEIKIHQRDAKELAELREVIYKLMAERDTPDAEEDILVDYPYTYLPEGIICFG